jgi:4-amino-4-deoxy-L-arabinose transferase-like glycosyltransferase
MNIRTKLLVVQLALITGVCGFLFFVGLGAFGLVGADEPRYAQIGREMLARHDWIVPTLNGTPWLEKPVLLYWQEMVSYKMFGVQDWAARVPSAFYASLLVLAAFFFMRRFRPGSELDAALITASCAAMIGFSRVASTDMQLSAPFCVAMLAWWTWHETGKKFWLMAFYLLLAIGALAKGPISPAMAVLIVAVYASLRRDGSIFVRSIWLPGFAVFFAAVLPWYVAVQIKVPSFLRVFFFEHNLERFGTNLYQHSQPFWYYIPVFILATMPWIVFTLPALVTSIREIWRGLRPSAPAAKLSLSDDAATEATETAPVIERDWLTAFFTLWTVLPILFFSISRSKLPGYILPGIPAATMLTAAYLHRTQQGKMDRLKVMLHSLVCGGLVAGALVAPWLITKQTVPDGSRTFIIVFAGVMAVFVLMLVRRNGLKVLHFATLVPLVLGLAFLLKPSASAVDGATSARAVNEQLLKDGITSGPVAVLNVRRDVEYGLNFYRNQPISRYERDGVPPQSHVVIAKQGSAEAVQAVVGERKATSLGTFPPQHLEFFRVSGVAQPDALPNDQITQNH